MLPPGAIFQLKIHPNAFAAGALPRTPLGQYNTALPKHSGWFLWGPFAARERREKGEGKRGDVRKGKGKGRKGWERSPLLFAI